MNFTDYQLQDRPLGVWRYTGSSHNDVSGNSLTKSGTENALSPVAQGGVRSLLISSTSTQGFTTPTTFWRVGYEKRAFSIEVVGNTLTLGGQPILYFGHASAGATEYDGLVQLTNGTWVFTVKFTSGSVSVRYTPPVIQNRHVVGVYTTTKIQLWIDGVMVAETDIPDGYVASGFSHGADVNLSSGSSLTTFANAAADGWAMYGYALSPEKIAAHAAAAFDVPNANQIVGQYGGFMFDGSERNVQLQKTWSSAADWATGIVNKVNYNDTGLFAAESQESGTLGQGLSGSWIGQFEIATLQITLDSIQIWWDAPYGGITVDVSFNGGSSYVGCNSGEIVPTSVGADPSSSGQNALVRVSFTSAGTNSPAILKSLSMRVLSDNIIPGRMGNLRNMFLVGNKYLSTYPYASKPIQQSSLGGFHWFSQGNLTLGTDSTGGTTRGYEFWVRHRGSGTGGTTTLLSCGTSTFTIAEPNGTALWANATVYLNGVLSTSNTVNIKYRWMHVYVELPSANNTAADIGTGDFMGEVAHIAYYPNSMTAGQVAALYNAYSNQTSLTQTNAPAQTLVEPGSPYVITVADWAMQTQQ